MLSRIEVGIALRMHESRMMSLASPAPLWVWEKDVLNWRNTVILSVRVAVYNTL